jgi:hypothetical protein
MNKQKIDELFEIANCYPSPHNGQPIEVQQLSVNNFNIFFQRERGLQAAEVSFLFSYVAMGVFVYHLALCAKALGHKLDYVLDLPSVESLKGTGLARFASCNIEWDVSSPDVELHNTLLFRQTSRKKYFEGLDSEISDHTISIANQNKMRLVKMDRNGTHQAIWLTGYVMTKMKKSLRKMD